MKHQHNWKNTIAGIHLKKTFNITKTTIQRSLSMKKFKQYTAMLSMLVFFLVFWGCQSETLSPEAPLPETPVSKQGLRFIPFAKKANSLHKVYQVTALVTKQNGGKLELDYDGDFIFELKLDIPRGAINEDIEITVSMDDEQFVGNYDVNFYPHGIVFNEPATLNLEADGLDLTNVNPNSVFAYYEDAATGTWERMPSDTVIVNQEDGEVKVKNAKIPHFSRYALASE